MNAAPVKVRIRPVERISPEDVSLVVLAGVVVLTWAAIFLAVIVEKRSLRRHRGAGLLRRSNG